MLHIKETPWMLFIINLIRRECLKILDEDLSVSNNKGWMLLIFHLIIDYMIIILNKWMMILNISNDLNV